MMHDEDFHCHIDIYMTYVYYKHISRTVVSIIHRCTICTPFIPTSYQGRN